MRLLLLTIAFWLNETPAYAYGKSVSTFLPWFRFLLVTIGLVSLAYALFSKEISKSWIFGLAAIFLYFISGLGTDDLSGMVLLLLIASGALILLEFLVPGFGIAGISGIILFVISLVLSMPEGFQGLLVLVTASMLILLMARAFVERGQTLPYVQKLISKNEQGKKNESPYQIGDRGMTLSDLRPSGFVDFDGKRVSVHSDGLFIERGRTVEIVSIHGKDIYVKEVS